MMVKCKRHISKDAPTEGVELNDFFLSERTQLLLRTRLIWTVQWVHFSMVWWHSHANTT